MLSRPGFVTCCAGAQVLWCQAVHGDTDGGIVLLHCMRGCRGRVARAHAVASKFLLQHALLQHWCQPSLAAA